MVDQLGSVPPISPIPAETPDQRLMTCLQIAAAVCFGASLDLGKGVITASSFPMMILGALLLLSTLAVPRAWLHRPGKQACWCLLVVALVISFCFVATNIPGIFLRIQTFFDLRFYYSLMVCAIMICGILAGGSDRIGRFAFPGLLFCYVVANWWIVSMSPNPHIDVFTMHDECCKALLQGINPFSITLPNIYPNDDLFPVGTVVNGRVMYGYSYPPLTLLLALPGHLLGDYRYAAVFATAAGAALCAYARPSNWSFLAVALLLYTPRGSYIVEMGWTELFLTLPLGLVAFTAARSPRLLPYAFGLLLASKQHLILAAPFALFLMPRPWTVRATVVFALKAGLAAALVTLPFLAWDAADYIKSVYSIHGKLRIRVDSISINAWLQSTFGFEIGTTRQLLVVAATMAIIFWRCPRTLAGFFLAMSAFYTVFFNCHKTAFSNHYFFLIACLAFAVACDEPQPADTKTEPE